MYDEAELTSALDAFEEALEIPVIPGELPAWSEGARRACNEAVAIVKDRVPTWHERIFAEMVEQDPELSTRIQHLRDEDAMILKEARQVEAEAGLIDGDSEELESRDPTIEQDVEGFVNRGLHWIIQVRKQEAALTTWYQEAFNRDRGVAD